MFSPATAWSDETLLGFAVPQPFRQLEALLGNPPSVSNLDHGTGEVARNASTAPPRSPRGSASFIANPVGAPSKAITKRARIYPSPPPL